MNAPISENSARSKDNNAVSRCGMRIRSYDYSWRRRNCLRTFAKKLMIDIFPLGDICIVLLFEEQSSPGRSSPQCAPFIHATRHGGLNGCNSPERTILSAPSPLPISRRSRATMRTTVTLYRRPRCRKEREREREREGGWGRGRERALSPADLIRNAAKFPREFWRRAIGRAARANRIELGGNFMTASRDDWITASRAQ